MNCQFPISKDEKCGLKIVKGYKYCDTHLCNFRDQNRKRCSNPIYAYTDDATFCTTHYNVCNQMVGLYQDEKDAGRCPMGENKCKNQTGRLTLQTSGDHYSHCSNLRRQVKRQCFHKDNPNDYTVNNLNHTLAYYVEKHKALDCYAKACSEIDFDKLNEQDREKNYDRCAKYHSDAINMEVKTQQLQKKLSQPPYNVPISDAIAKLELFKKKDSHGKNLSRFQHTLENLRQQRALAAELEARRLAELEERRQAELEARRLAEEREERRAAKKQKTSQKKKQKQEEDLFIKELQMQNKKLRASLLKKMEDNLKGEFNMDEMSKAVIDLIDVDKEVEKYNEKDYNVYFETVYKISEHKILSSIPKYSILINLVKALEKQYDDVYAKHKKIDTSSKEIIDLDKKMDEISNQIRLLDEKIGENLKMLDLSTNGRKKKKNAVMKQIFELIKMEMQKNKSLTEETIQEYIDYFKNLL